MAQISVYRSYAKINLYLDVLNRRRDGYHNIETVFQTVDLADRLTLEARPGGQISVTCSDPGLPCGPGNLVHKAAALLQHESGCTQGAQITLDKHIPVAAGLAGGSGNAAATLVALNALWGLRLSTPRLHALAARLGADVPYCLDGGTVAATGRGDDLTLLDPLPETWFVLIHPPVQVRTAAVYGSPDLAKNHEPRFAGRTASFRRALRALSRGNLQETVFNRMESAAFPMHPMLAGLKDELIEAGCVTAAMSGSGPTVFGVCPDRQHAEAVARAFADHRTTVAAQVPRGVVVV